ncbi:MAG: hypothetical protein ACK4NA_16285 [Alphaproteobacteria bacterium]
MSFSPRLLLSVMTALTLGACAYGGERSSNPLTLSMTWFSYLDAGDLRKACAAGGPEAYRIAFNGNYDEQLRTYDVTDVSGAGARMAVRVRGMTGDVLGLRLEDPLRSWRGDQSVVSLSPADMAALRQSLADSGAFAPAPAGLELKAQGFYWIVAACQAGRFSYHAWQWPGAAYDRLSFPALLARLDRTGVPLNPPRDTRPAYPTGRDLGDQPTNFQLRVGKDGIANLLTAF